MYYAIRESLTPLSLEEVLALPEGQPFVAVLTREEWQKQRGLINIDIDLDMEDEAPRETKVMVNLRSLTGTLSVPDRQRISGPRHSLAFAMDGHALALVDDSGYALSLAERIGRTKLWRLPSLERFLYDLLETVIAPDPALLETMEKQLDSIEERILKGEVEEYPQAMNDIRGDLLDLRLHYDQLIDLGQELEENENDFFRDENLRYFRMFTERVTRLKDMANSQREYVMQLRDLIQAQMDARQNRIMTVLTVITTIFLPLTLIAGWYGMNFRYMPELEWRYSYPALIVISVLIVVVCVLWFKRKKWM